MNELKRKKNEGCAQMVIHLADEVLLSFFDLGAIGSNTDLESLCGMNFYVETGSDGES